MSIEPNVNTQITNLNEVDVPETLEINEKNFPDETFRKYISKKFDKGKKGFLTKEEIYAVRKINVSHKNITSLIGIEYFKNLEHLNCKYTKIKDLHIRSNPELKRLDCKGTDIKELEIGNNANLKYLDYNPYYTSIESYLRIANISKYFNLFFSSWLIIFILEIITSIVLFLYVFTQYQGDLSKMFLSTNLGSFIAERLSDNTGT